MFCQLAGMSNGFFVCNSLIFFKSKHGSLIQDNSPSTVYFTDTRHRSVICTSGLIATNNSCLWSLLKGRAFRGVLCDSFSNQRMRHTSNLSRIPRVYPCKFFLDGVNFYRFNAKNWHFQQILCEKVAFFFLQI